MATAFSAWVPDVMPHVPGCPQPMVEDAVRWALIELCKLGRVWRYRSIAAVNAVASQQDYAPVAPAGTVIAHVYQVNWDGAKIDPLTPAEFIAKSETWNLDVGTPECWTSFEEGQVSLWEIPEASGVGLITFPEVALAPAQAATSISNDSIFERFREVVAIGAKGRLMAMPKKPYSDPPLGMALLGKFASECGSAQLRVASGRGQARLRTGIFWR